MNFSEVFIQQSEAFILHSEEIIGLKFFKEEGKPCNYKKMLTHNCTPTFDWRLQQNY